MVCADQGERKGFGDANKTWETAAVVSSCGPNHFMYRVWWQTRSWTLLGQRVYKSMGQAAMGRMSGLAGRKIHDCKLTSWHWPRRHVEWSVAGEETVKLEEQLLYCQCLLTETYSHDKALHSYFESDSLCVAGWRSYKMGFRDGRLVRINNDLGFLAVHMACRARRSKIRREKLGRSIAGNRLKPAVCREKGYINQSFRTLKLTIGTKH
jgi:hypothetical protein